AHFAFDEDVVALDVELEALVAAHFEKFLDFEGGELGVIEEVGFELRPLLNEENIRLAEGLQRLRDDLAVLHPESDRSAGLGSDGGVEALAIAGGEAAEGGSLISGGSR